MGSELRQSQIAARQAPPGGENPAGTGNAENLNVQETLNSPEQEQAARSSLMGKKMQILAQKTAGQVTVNTGRAGQAGAFILQRIGSLLLSFGLGTGLTIVGLIIGLPLLIVGVACSVAGILISIGAKATVLAGEAIVKRAKAEEAKLNKEQGGMVGAVKGATETARTAMKYASFIAGPFIYVGCTLLGMLAGWIFMGFIIVAALGG